MSNKSIWDIAKYQIGQTVWTIELYSKQVDKPKCECCGQNLPPIFERTWIPTKGTVDTVNILMAYQQLDVTYKMSEFYGDIEEIFVFSNRNEAFEAAAFLDSKRILTKSNAIEALEKLRSANA